MWTIFYLYPNLESIKDNIIETTIAFYQYSRVKTNKCQTSLSSQITRTTRTHKFFVLYLDVRTSRERLDLQNATNTNREHDETLIPAKSIAVT